MSDLRKTKLTLNLNPDKQPVVDISKMESSRRRRPLQPTTAPKPFDIAKNPAKNNARAEADKLFKVSDDKKLSDTETDRREQALAAAEKRKAEEEERIAAEKAEAEKQAKLDAELEQVEKEIEEMKQLGPTQPTQALPTAKPAEPKIIPPKPRKNLPADKPRRAGKLTVQDALNTDDEAQEQKSTRAAALKRRNRKRNRNKTQEPPQKIFREVSIPDTITVQDLALRMSERAVDIIKVLMSQGQMVTNNSVLDADTAQLIAEELGHTVKRVSDSDVLEGVYDIADDPNNLQSRPPVVTIMGHVDHGKTTLLDVLRKSNITAGEAGGITQHIGAYQITKNNQKITFLDTPGHAAFTEMRARGAQATDIVVLVVAADDGVQPQTKEAIAHAKAANVPIIVAINKCDLPGADPARVQNELLREDIIVESMGGETLEVIISAKQGTNLDKLTDAILLQAEMAELQADPDRLAAGVVLEAKLDKGRGNVATILVQKGVLRIGDILVAGAFYGRIKAVLDDLGNKIETAEPSQPVAVLGFNGCPAAGEKMIAVESEARAREITEFRTRIEQQQKRVAKPRATLEDLLNSQQNQEYKEFNLLVKADVQGSAEAIAQSLKSIGNSDISANLVFAGVGGITEADVVLASTSNAVLLGFNVRANPNAERKAKDLGVEIRYYNIIYDLTDDVKKAMSGMLTPTKRENVLGRAEILKVFSIGGVGKIAGCRVMDGVIKNGCKVRVLRQNMVVVENKIRALKLFKDNVSEIKAGKECGINLDSFEDFKVDDCIECYEVQEIERTLEG